MTHRMVPVGRVGLYVPGGIAPLVSSVVMNVVPAQVAGVASIALSSPPQKDHGGLPHPTIMAACALLGVDEVYAVGGAQAIAMFAYGAGPCRPVDLVTGPGSIHTVAAKRLLKGRIGIDSEAGPTEIAVLADDSADAAYVAADLISQAEHDVLAASVLVTPSERLADDVEAELEKQVHATRHTERIRTSLTSQQSAIVLVDDLEQGLAVVDAYAAEHLEIQTEDAAAWAARVRNAGAIFVGSFAPGLAGRLLRRLQPRAADGRLRVPLLGPVGAGVPQVGARRRLRPRRAGRGGRPRGDPRRGRGPARRTAPRSACGWHTSPGHDLPALARGARRPRAVRRAPARRTGPAQRQREPVPAVRGRGRRHRVVGGVGRRHASTATPTGSSPSCGRLSRRT